jgi:hypothetical protein
VNVVDQGLLSSDRQCKTAAARGAGSATRRRHSRPGIAKLA